MRALLICPPSSWTPPGALPRHAPLFSALAAGGLRQAGWQVDLEDHHRGTPSMSTLLRRVRALAPDLLLLTLCDDNRHVRSVVLRRLVRELRDACPEVPLIGFGRLSQDAAQDCGRKVPELAAIAWGEPDLGARGIAEALDAGDLARAPGLWLRGEDGALRPTGDALTDASRCARPAWDLCDPRDYPFSPHQATADPVFPVLASRGCPWPCFFCEVRDQPAWTARPVDDVVAEIRWVTERFGTRSFFFADPNLVVDGRWTRALCDALVESGPERLTWSCMARTDRVTPEILQAMARAGCWCVLYGIESRHPEALKSSRKGLDPTTVAPAIRWTQEAGMEAIASAMIGLPGDSPAGVRSTVDWLIDLEPDYAQFFVVQLRAGSVPEGGRYLTEWEVAHRDFAGRVFAPDSFTDAAQLRALQNEAYRRFYARPSYAVKRVRALMKQDRPIAEAARLARGALLAAKMSIL